MGILSFVSSLFRPPLCCSSSSRLFPGLHEKDHKTLVILNDTSVHWSKTFLVYTSNQQIQSSFPHESPTIVPPMSLGLFPPHLFAVHDKSSWSIVCVTLLTHRWPQTRFLVATYASWAPVRTCVHAFMFSLNWGWHKALTSTVLNLMFGFLVKKTTLPN